jgi:phosphoribosyl-dephospho-CoA transferase
MGFTHINWSEDKQQKRMDESGVENYIIIDDDSDMLYNQRHHFVHVLPSPRNYDGFNQHYYKIAKAMLDKSCIELNYCEVVDNTENI